MAWTPAYARVTGAKVSAIRPNQALPASATCAIVQDPELRDLASPPGNRLEALSGNRKGQHSVRINSQFRVCFVWTPKGPKNVEIVDYH